MGDKITCHVASQISLKITVKVSEYFCRKDTENESDIRKQLRPTLQYIENKVFLSENNIETFIIIVHHILRNSDYRLTRPKFKSPKDDDF